MPNALPPGGGTGGGTLDSALTPDFARIRTGDRLALHTALQTIWKLIHESILRRLDRLAANIDLRATVVAFDATNFLASAGAWTVIAANHTDVSFHLTGDWMTVNFTVLNTNVTAVSTLRLRVPGGYTIKSVNAQNLIRVTDAGAAVAVGFAQANAVNGTLINLFPTVAGGTFAITAASNTSVRGQVSFQVERGL